LTIRYHGHIVGGKSDKGQDVSLQIEMGNVGYNGGFVMSSVYSDVRFEKLESMRVASHCIISRNPEEQVTSYLSKWAEGQGVKRTRSFGFDYPVSDEQREKGFRGYEYWIVVPDHITESEGVIIKDIAEDEYAVLRITDPFSDPFDRIPRGWKQLSEWVCASDYRPRSSQNRFILEEVIEDEDGNTYMDLFFPVK